MWARSSAFLRSNCVRRTTTSRRKSMKCRRRSLSGSTCGRPWTIARLITPNVDWSFVNLYRLFRMTPGFSSRFSSITMRIPSRSDSSRMSEIPSIRLSRTSAAISSMSCVLFTWYGSSVMMIACRSLRCVLLLDRGAPAHDDAPAARLVGGPDPGDPVDEPGGREVGARHQPSSARESSTSGFSTMSLMTSTTSPRLCGGMFVAMPTAIPDEPLTRRFGNAAGRTSGSVSAPS